MSVMDSMSKLCSGSGEESVNQIVHMLASHPGGTAGLMQTFREQGLGGVLSSWLGSGANQPISADQIQKVFSNARIAAIANKCGVSPETVSAEIAEVLPVAVDRLSPHGTLPAGEDLRAKAGSLLTSLFSTRT
jgi:uncharacterized protein YidB (DUF937 family)